ncbi:MAG: hypothetical protein JRF33_06590 [Deltaproteobacteria bacterium]|nr:hypothetical protein [Deltaproteobacteria bacterium]
MTELQSQEATAIVALTRWARPMNEELMALAPLLGETAYDLRLRMAGPAPVLVGQRLSLDQARDLLQVLLGRGHGAVAFEAKKVLDRAQIQRPRRIGIDGDILSLRTPDERRALDLKQIFCLLLAVHRSHEESSETIKQKKFSAGRAVMTGGLIRNKKKKVTITQSEDHRERVLYLFRRDGLQTIALHESLLIMEAEAEAIEATRNSNFTALLERIRQAAPHANYDERLSLPRKLDEIDLPAFMRSSTNALDVLAHCLVIAYAQNQIDPA